MGNKKTWNDLLSQAANRNALDVVRATRGLQAAGEIKDCGEDLLYLMVSLGFRRGVAYVLKKLAAEAEDDVVKKIIKNAGRHRLEQLPQWEDPKDPIDDDPPLGAASLDVIDGEVKR